MWYIWLIAAGIFFLVEIATVGFLIFWLGIGALFAMITSFICDSIFIQTAVFVFTSVILILLTKPLINKWIKNSKTIVTNSASLIDKLGIVTIDINSLEGVGQIKVDGEIWSAKTETNDIILKGTKVKILKIDGVKLIVSPIKEENKI